MIPQMAAFNSPDPPKAKRPEGENMATAAAGGGCRNQAIGLAMPFSEESREDLSWILKEIVDGGGDGSVSEVRFIEGLNDEQVISLFQNARGSDYEKSLRKPLFCFQSVLLSRMTIMNQK
jgi:hypothetical protein